MHVTEVGFTQADLTLFVNRPMPMGLTYGVKDKPSNYSAWLHFNKQDVSVCVCVYMCV